MVLAAAGSSDPAANATIAALAARWAARARLAARRARLRVGVGAAAGRGGAGAAVRPEPDGPVVVATYLLAPGYFADKIRDGALGAGASAVSGVLGAARRWPTSILDRYDAAGTRFAPRSSRAPGYIRDAIAASPVRKSLHTGKPTWNRNPARCHGANNLTR